MCVVLVDESCQTNHAEVIVLTSDRYRQRGREKEVISSVR
jgi:hypothetical protein